MSAAGDINADGFGDVVVGAELAEKNNGKVYVYNGRPDADLNCDRVVDRLDLVLLLEQWGPCSGCPGDFDRNMRVDFGDVISLLSSWSGM